MITAVGLDEAEAEPAELRAVTTATTEWNTSLDCSVYVELVAFGMFVHTMLEQSFHW